SPVTLQPDVSVQQYVLADVFFFKQETGIQVSQGPEFKRVLFRSETPNPPPTREPLHQPRGDDQ
ncbi:hypothetical protein, partial [Pseudomonas sp. MWU12-2323]|uniref:hypothetical protein n=1 Tax=Pseudomonas sp. MWU12-2323 TaxID=2651296 RepID=UPI001C49A40B